MGTNYYHRTNICKHCNRFEEKHIGKSSAGWQFNFQGYNAEQHRPPIMSFEDWKKELDANGKIVNEYGKECSFEEFVKMVEDKQTDKFNHFDYCTEKGYNMDNDWHDGEGYSFTSSDFS